MLKAFLDELVTTSASSRREQMESLFNQMVCCLVRWGLLDGERIAALDGSKRPPPPTYEGCGKLKQTRAVKVKGQKERAIEEDSVSGWKVLVRISVQTRLPLAMKIVTIQEYEGRWGVSLLEQAQRNLGTRGHISTIVIDRGYLDGQDLWQVHQKGIIFVVVSKANMAVTRGAPRPWPSGSVFTCASGWYAMATAKRRKRSACAPNWWASRH